MRRGRGKVETITLIWEAFSVTPSTSAHDRKEQIDKMRKTKRTIITTFCCSYNFSMPAEVKNCQMHKSNHNSVLKKMLSQVLKLLRWGGWVDLLGHWRESKYLWGVNNLQAGSQPWLAVQVVIHSFCFGKQNRVYAYRYNKKTMREITTENKQDSETTSRECRHCTTLHQQYMYWWGGIP